MLFYSLYLLKEIDLGQMKASTPQVARLDASLMRIWLLGIFISALTYAGLFYINSWLTSSFLYSTGMYIVCLE